MKKEYLELYTDYLIASFGKTTATGLSEILDGAISHDKITRFLSKEDYTSKELWQLVKPEVRAIEEEDGVLIFDDTVQEKQYSKESELICWHWDHTFNRNIKGINLLNCVYQANGVSLPIAFELVKKPIQFSDLKTRKQKRKSEITKNEMLRDMLKTCQQNQVKWRYLLADSWFSSSENMKFVNDTFTALAKSPTSTVRTQSNHVFMSIYASSKLEILAIKHKVNTFALRAKLYISALKNAFLGLQKLKGA